MPGVGLLGMRERVTALGGRLRADPRTGGGFTVRAEAANGKEVLALAREHLPDLALVDISKRTSCRRTPCGSRAAQQSAPASMN